MSELPRIAVGTVQPDVDPQPMLWALMEVLRRRKIRVQDFVSRACFPRHRAAEVITGLRPRYLDSWLMSEPRCREIFVRSSELSDLALVEGDFFAHSGGELETLCQWLRLPRIVLVDAPSLGPALPSRPPNVDGVLLDRVADDGQAARLLTDVETVWRVPVLGMLPEMPRVRQAIQSVPPGERPSQDLCRECGDRLAECWDFGKIDQLARSFPLSEVEGDLYRRDVATLTITVAVAFDEAFNCYFPCGLDLLELRGATIVTFSPLHDEKLPPGADIVFLGSGHPDRHAQSLAENHCMMASLRDHVRRGRRMYAEGAGLAYLCEHMETDAGQMMPMTGVFPGAARLERPPAMPEPTEVVLDRANWLGSAGTKLRGYRNPHWRLEPLGPLRSFLATGEHCHDLVGAFEAVGSLLHLNFAAQEAALNHFFYPHPVRRAL